MRIYGQGAAFCTPPPTMASERPGQAVPQPSSGPWPDCSVPTCTVAGGSWGGL